MQHHSFLPPQNTLHMNVTNNNYSDPNNLTFQEIRILGLAQEPVSVDVLQNNVVQNSSHNITYSPADKVSSAGKGVKSRGSFFLKSTITSFPLRRMLIDNVRYSEEVDLHPAPRQFTPHRVCFRVYLRAYVQHVVRISVGILGG